MADELLNNWRYTKELQLYQTYRFMQRRKTADTIQVPAPKRARRKPVAKKRPNQTKNRAGSSHKKPDDVPLRKSPETPKAEPAPHDRMPGIMFAQACELIPGIGLSIPFDGDRIMVLPFDTMPPSLQHLVFNDPTCHSQDLQQDPHVIPDITSCYGTCSDAAHNYSWACMGDVQPPVQPAYFPGVPSPAYCFQGQVCELENDTRLPNQSTFTCDRNNM
ncbi:hypothetical protein ACHAPA_010625 [Fusarium lateritium]